MPSVPAVYLDYLGLIFPGLMLLGVAFTRWNDARLYGRAYTAALKATRRAATGGKRFFLWGGRFLILSSLLMPLLLLASYYESSATNVSALAPAMGFICLSFFAVGLATTRWVTAPPGVLVLGASASLMGRQLADLLHMPNGHRVMFFLAPDALHRARAGRSLSLEEANREIFSNMYQGGAVNWEKVVVPLILLAPVLVVDATVFSDGLVAELDRIEQDSKLAEKAIIYHSPRHGSDFRALEMLQQRPSLRRRIVNDPQQVVELARQLLLRRRRERLRAPRQSEFASPGTRLERNPYLPLVMDCPTTGRTFALGVNSGVWELSEGGRTRCPICGDWHEFNRQNTKAVAFAQAAQLPRV